MSAFSFRTILSGLQATARRFPFEVMVAFLATTVAVVLVHESHLGLTRETTRLLTVSVVAGILLFASQLAITLTYEVGGIGAAMMRSLRAVAMILAVAVALILDLDSEATPIQIASLFVGTHACIVLAPWNRGPLATWDIGRALLVRVATAGLFTSVLSGGLVLAVTSLDALFDIEVAGEVYGDINIVCLGMFNTLIVLAGVPRTSDAMMVEPPVAIRWFVQFVLIPLVLIFLVILYAYGIRVVFFSDLRGAVAGYILALNVFALLALVLAWPLRHHPQHRVVGFFLRVLGPIMVPMTVLLVLAIGIRIADYGVTPPRFGVALLTSFVVLVNVYLLRRRDVDLRVFPLLLAVIGLVTALGPLGSAQSTIRSQSRRLESALRDAGALGSNALDTTRFQLANDTIRSAFFGAIETIRSIDTASARALLVRFHVPFSQDSSAGALVINSMGIPIMSIVVDRDRPYYDLSSPSNDQRGIDLPRGRAAAFTVSSTGASDRSGDWQFFYSNTIKAVILSRAGTSIKDSIMLRPVFNETMAANDSPQTPLLLTSTTGKRFFLLQDGFIRFDRDTSIEFRFTGMLIDADGVQR